MQTSFSVLRASAAVPSLSLEGQCRSCLKPSVVQTRCQVSVWFPKSLFVNNRSADHERGKKYRDPAVRRWAWGWSHFTVWRVRCGFVLEHTGGDWQPPLLPHMHLSRYRCWFSYKESKDKSYYKYNFEQTKVLVFFWFYFFSIFVHVTGIFVLWWFILVSEHWLLMEEKYFIFKKKWKKTFGYPHF